jgi:hypothetical protein
MLNLLHFREKPSLPPISQIIGLVRGLYFLLPIQVGCLGYIMVDPRLHPEIYGQVATHSAVCDRLQ